MNKIGFKAGKDESKPVEREIQHQEYYKTKSGLECIDVAQDFDFNLGKKFENGLSTKEKAVEDLQKAKVYIDYEIIKIKGDGRE